MALFFKSRSIDGVPSIIVPIPNKLNILDFAQEVFSCTKRKSGWKHTLNVPVNVSKKEKSFTFTRKNVCNNGYR